MKIFLSAVFDTNKKNLLFLKKIEEALELKGAEMLCFYFSEDEETSSTIYLKMLQKADICVFETSINNLIIGFLIAKSLELNKPTIILCSKNDSFFKKLKNEKLVFQRYDNQKNVEKKINQAFKKAQKLRDRRFNFFISPDLLNYLEQESRKLGITKSMLIRQLIIKHKKNFINQ